MIEVTMVRYPGKLGTSNHANHVSVIGDDPMAPSLQDQLMLRDARVDSAQVGRVGARLVGGGGVFQFVWSLNKDVFWKIYESLISVISMIDINDIDDYTV